MSEKRDLKARELDALREVASIGAGHAETALSQLTGRKVMINVPELHMARLVEIPEVLHGPADDLAVVYMNVFGDLTGRTLLTFEQQPARSLVDILTGRDPGTTREIGELEGSALKETANILGGSYLNALSEFLGLMLLPSVPVLAVDRPEKIFTPEFLKMTDTVEHVISIENQLYVTREGNEVVGNFILVPDPSAVSVILDALRIP